nr:M20 family metallopeptidase [uncultured Agrococcus sp.]
MVSIRRSMHRHPEVGLDLPWTQQLVVEELAGLPVELTLGKSLSSVTAVLRGTASGAGERPAVLLRADMDALPLQELTSLEYASELDERMHGCGHDLHTAMLIGAVHLLTAKLDEIYGDIVFMFQPGEEGFDGASYMLREGVLEAAGRRVDAAYALHVFSSAFPRGQVLSKPGTLMASADSFKVTVTGAGGHGSAPHLAKDPVAAMAEMITATQVTLTRKLNALDPAVVSVGVVRAGTQQNIIPETAEFDATVRCFSEESRTRVEEELGRLYRGIADAHDVEVDVDYARLYPPTVNDGDEVTFALATAEDLFGGERVQEVPTSLTASEDFSRVLAEVPGAFILLGAAVGDGDPADAPFNHSAYAQFDDEVLLDGASLLTELALRRLAAAASDETRTP